MRYIVTIKRYNENDAPKVSKSEIRRQISKSNGFYWSPVLTSIGATGDTTDDLENKKRPPRAQIKSKAICFLSDIAVISKNDCAEIVPLFPNSQSVSSADCSTRILESYWCLD